MPLLFKSLAAALGAACTLSAFGAACSNEDFATRVSGAGECVVIAAYGQQTTAKPSTLVVWLHGDQSDGRAPNSHLKPAQAAAERLGGQQVLNIALWRPGYSNAQGDTSGGTNYDRTDSYTKANMAIVGEAVERLKSHYAVARVILVGHSGGAATAANLLGMRPGLADAAVLVSCPCDLRTWRQGRRWWSRSEDPLAWADKVASTTKVIALTGTADDNTLPKLATAYVAALNARRVEAKFVAIDNADHNGAFTAGAVIDAVASLVQ